MRHRRTLPSLVAVLALGVVACGDDGSATTSTPTTTAVTTTQPATTQPATTEPATTEPATTVPDGLEQPAIWPSAEVVYATPEEAATDFVETALGVPAVLGEFAQGDSRSGEIEVFFEADGQPQTEVARSTLLMRQLGPGHGWFVIAAVSEGVIIDAPSTGDMVAAGSVEVTGDARGFERTIVVRAFPAGDATVIDNQLATGGGNETPEPFEASLDLSGVGAGDFVVILVRGDTGLETDPGEFSAIPVVIG